MKKEFTLPKGKATAEDNQVIIELGTEEKPLSTLGGLCEAFLALCQLLLHPEIIPEGATVEKATVTNNRVIIEISKGKERPNLPTCFEDLKEINGFYISDTSEIIPTSACSTDANNKNISPLREICEAYLALCQLLQLAKAYQDHPKFKEINGLFTIGFPIERLDPSVAKVHTAGKTKPPIVFLNEECANSFISQPKIKELLKSAKILL